MTDIARLQELVSAGYEVRFAKLDGGRCQVVIFDERDKFAAEGATVGDAFEKVRELYWKEMLLWLAVSGRRTADAGYEGGWQDGYQDGFGDGQMMAMPPV